MLQRVPLRALNVRLVRRAWSTSGDSGRLDHSSSSGKVKPTERHLASQLSDHSKKVVRFNAVRVPYPLRMNQTDNDYPAL